ncbi:hypothetical protein GCM10009824_25780 [Kocuria atrinae]|uniref:DUF308 domain-containing protein n=2 Tax=Kocuria atrinae TaxID=592377 RepID=A0ABN2Y829_9MICC
MGTMDSMDTWPTPVTVDDRGFDLKAMQELRRNPSATSGNAGSSPAGNASPPDGASDPGAAASGTSEASPASPGAPAKVGTREKLANSMILVIPVVSALAIVLCWMRYADTNNGLWLGAIAVILVLAAITWISSVKKAFARAQGHLATRLPGVIGYGVGIIREVDVDSPFDENGVSDTVTAHLVLSVNPVQGPKFQAPIDAVYNTSDSEKLTVGAHGPVRYLRSDPENTVSIETRLDDARIRQIYQGAAMN